jgi:hypothetical protein
MKLAGISTTHTAVTSTPYDCELLPVEARSRLQTSATLCVIQRDKVMKNC